MVKPIPNCAVCERKPKEGCSHVDCPHRRQITAQVPGYDVGSIFVPGTSHRPAPIDQED